jgi:hypothetical protein
MGADRLLDARATTGLGPVVHICVTPQDGLVFPAEPG